MGGRPGRDAATAADRAAALVADSVRIGRDHSGLGLGVAVDGMPLSYSTTGIGLGPFLKLTVYDTWLAQG
ncbi:hypothetical protein OG936_32830 [Streptomyces sp. NBC_00846]|uniref:hypothetical protein n=1 Tax=Streptomyces sp. NBC_00846 TaxID=2975849 RepID=UPI003866E54F|nr:hypothetical protein OG936_32830 [Streptomyces sp. NBC_00846]